MYSHWRQWYEFIEKFGYMQKIIILIIKIKWCAKSDQLDIIFTLWFRWYTALFVIWYLGNFLKYNMYMASPCCRDIQPPGTKVLLFFIVSVTSEFFWKSDTVNLIWWFWNCVISITLFIFCSLFNIHLIGSCLMFIV